MKKYVCLLIVMALAVYSDDGIASEKQTERKNKLSKEKIALIVVSALAVAGGVTLVKVVQKNKSLVKENKSLVKILENTQEEGKNTLRNELEALHIKVAGQIEAARDAGEKTFAKFLNGIPSFSEVKYRDDFVKQIEEIVANKQPDWDYHDALTAGNLQEIVWRLRENGDIDAADEMEKLLISSLQEEKIINIEAAAGGRTGAQILTFNNGMRGVFKLHESWESIAMYRFDKLLGTDIYPIAVQREVKSNKGSIQLFVENSISLQQAGRVYGSTSSSLSIPHTRRINTLALLSSDTDMDDHNVLIPVLGRLFAINGGHAFDIYIGREMLEESLSEALKNNFHQYYIHPYFIKRLQSINDEDLHYVAEPLFNVFSEDEFKILKNFEDVIVSKSSEAELITAIETGTLSGMATQLRKIYQTEWVGKIEDEFIERRIIERVDYYRDLLTVPDFLRQSIEDYIAAVQEIQHLR